MGNSFSYQRKLRKFRRYVTEDYSATPEMSDLITAIVRDTFHSTTKHDYETPEACQRVADEIVYRLWSTSGGLWRCILLPSKIDFNVKPRPRNFIKFEIQSKKVGRLDIALYQELTSDQFNPACARVPCDGHQH
uniref:Uncharacterized protein n=1 Tax=Panagrolaimus sp. JU765 TaxID=591449 RepID=A0AC34QN43_9BILA